MQRTLGYLVCECVILSVCLSDSPHFMPPCARNQPKSDSNGFIATLAWLWRESQVKKPICKSPPWDSTLALHCKLRCLHAANRQNAVEVSRCLKRYLTHVKLHESYLETMTQQHTSPVLTCACVWVQWTHASSEFFKLWVLNPKKKKKKKPIIALQYI